ncbi:importin-alpha export receptor [Geranomyces variabilis]|nr:importin-alpha export receptor [Geranomyces variabilis]
MQASPEAFQFLSERLAQTLNPQTGKQAEQELAKAEAQISFPVLLLKLIEASSADQTVRLVGSIYFKNYVKRRWEQSDNATDGVAAADRSAIKAHIVSLMMVVPPAVQTQLGEAVAIIADADFPTSWTGLIPELLSKISPVDHAGNIGLLQIAHSTFKRYRAAVRSNALFTEIKFVIDQFATAFLELVKTVDAAITASTANPQALQPMFQEMTLLTRIFYDLNFQELPEWFEDNQEAFMSIFRKYLTYQNAALQSDDDSEIGPIERLQTAICEVLDLYAKKYEDDFVSLRQCVDIIWHLMISAGSQPKFDLLVSKAIGFLTTIVQSSRNRDIFANADTLKAVCEQVVLPNMTLRESDEELFEDDPIEYIRRDLEGSDTDTRRRAASDLVRGLLEHFAKEVTEIFSVYVSHNLQTYEKNQGANWKAKDTALYLITSLSARSTTLQAGVTKVNEFIEVLPVFTQHVLPELQSAAEGSAHPIIKVDAIKFLMVFRSQLTKEQLNTVFPFLLNHLASSNYVVYTYSAVCIERILATKMANGAMQFHETDIAAVAHPILNHLFNLIEKNSTSPAKLAENDYLMKAAMRIIIVAKQELEPVAVELVGRLTKVIEVISQNPSNPKFNHYTFEALAALIRFICARKPALVNEFEPLLFPPLLSIITQQIAEFTPYSLQILAQMLDFHSGGQIPQYYQNMLHDLVMPPLWQANGNIPALIKLLQSYFSQSPMTFAEPKLLEPVLGVVHKLISSRATDHYGFDLLSTVFEYLPMTALDIYLKKIFILLLTRLTQAKTPKFTRGLLNFTSFLFLLKKDGLTADTIIKTYDTIQATPLFCNLLDVLIPELEIMLTPRERKSNIVGLSNLLAQSTIMRTDTYLRYWSPLLQGLIKLCDTPAAQTKNRSEEEELYTFEIDDEGYQASFSKLMVVAQKPRDLTAGIPDAKSYLASSVDTTIKADPRIKTQITTQIFDKLREYLNNSVPAPLR